MICEIDRSVSDLFPGFAAAFLKCGSMPHTQGSVRAHESGVIQAINQSFHTIDEIENHPYSEAYAAFYRKMGLKIKKVSTPLKQAARVYAAKTYRSILPVIDVCMAIEYSTLVSFQIFDADTIRGDLIYALATGNETLLSSNGDEKVCKAGELILKERAGSVIHSSYYGTNTPNKLSAQSRQALVRIMKVPGIERGVFDSVVGSAADALCAQELVVAAD